MDKGEFAIKLGVNLRRDHHSIAMTRAAIGEFAEPFMFVTTTRDVLFGVHIAEFIEGEAATLSDLECSREEFGGIREQASHLRGGQKRVLVISSQ